MPRKLTLPEIEKLASLPKVRRIAVENFLITVQNNPDVLCAKMNLDADARLYRWKKETVNAIKQGIKLSSGR